MPGGDSVKLIGDQNFRRIHSDSTLSGKLQKGNSSQLRNASIPSKYQTFVMPNSDNKGFNSQSKRFQFSPTDAPGPGAYSSSTNTAVDTQSLSHSKTGFGPMASKATRFPQKFTFENSPSPNSYEVIGKTDRDFNRSVFTHQFHLPVAKSAKTHPLISKEKSKLPAPNLYDVAMASEHRNKPGAVSQFKSASLRSSDQHNRQPVPGPGYYNVNDDYLKPSTETNGAIHCFQSTSDRLQIYKNHSGPGPASYNIDNIPDRNSAGFQFPKKHFLCLSAPAIPPAKPGPMPGPGHYNVTAAPDGSNFPMSSAAFVSNTSRWQINTLNEDSMPGPAQYNPQKLSKQSFLFNGKHNWVS